jgi:hypothetical protein
MGSSIFDGDTDYKVYVSLNLITTVLGSFASLFTILLIYRMGVKTGHVKLVLTMSIFQLMYDVTFFFSNVDCGYYISVVANIFQVLGGIAGSLVSNWIAFIALYIILYRRKFDIFGHYLKILASCMVPGLVDVVIFLVATCPEDAQNDELLDVSILDYYYYLRIGSICLNFIFVFVACYKVDLMSSKTSNKSEQEIAIRTLARRLILYPIVQAIGRSGYAWYEFEYGVDIDTDDPTDQQFASLIFLTIITPFVSIGYLIIFLVMQPNAYKEFKKMVFCRDYESPTNKTLSKNDADNPNPLRPKDDDTLSYYTDGYDVNSNNKRPSRLTEEVRKGGDGDVEMSMTEIRPTEMRPSTMPRLTNNLKEIKKFGDEELLDFIVESEKREGPKASNWPFARSSTGPKEVHPGKNSSLFRSSLTGAGSFVVSMFTTTTKSESNSESTTGTNTTKKRGSTLDVLNALHEKDNEDDEEIEMKSNSKSRDEEDQQTDRRKTNSSNTHSSEVVSGRTTKALISDDRSGHSESSHLSKSLKERITTEGDSYKFDIGRESDFLSDARESVEEYYIHQQKLSDSMRDSKYK